MKKVVSRLLAFALTASLLLTGCGGGTATEEKENAETSTQKTEQSEEGKKEEAKEEKKGEQIKDLVIPKVASKEISGFNILYTQKGEDFEGLSSLMDGLLEIDTSGKLIPAIAEEWGTEDEGHTWTFKVRQGVKWVNVNGEEVAECNAQDFATGLEWILNFHKNDSTNTSMPLEMIEGANEYYEYTKTLSKEEAYALTAGEGSKFREMVGLDTPDDYTLVYTCIDKKPYFDTLAPYVSLYPASQKLIDEVGVDGFRAINNENMWYNGCYTMTSYIQGNEKVYTKNPLYWDTDCTLFDTVTVKMVESNDVAFQLYQAGEVDYVGLGEAQINTIAKNPDNEFYNYLVPDVPAKYCYQFQLNYHKLFDDGSEDVNWNTAAANEAFRLSWWYGLDLKEYYKRTNAVNPMACENNFYTMKGLVYTSDGTDYTELVRQEMGLPEANGETMVRLDAEKAAAYKQQAIEELTALGVTFPVTIDYFISGSNQNALDLSLIHIFPSGQRWTFEHRGRVLCTGNSERNHRNVPGIRHQHRRKELRCHRQKQHRGQTDGSAVAEKQRDSYHLPLQNRGSGKLHPPCRCGHRCHRSSPHLDSGYGQRGSRGCRCRHEPQRAGQAVRRRGL